MQERERGSLIKASEWQTEIDAIQNFSGKSKLSVWFLSFIHFSLSEHTHTIKCVQLGERMPLIQNYAVYNWFKLLWVIWEREWEWKWAGDEQHNTSRKKHKAKWKFEEASIHWIWYGKYTLCAFKTFNYVFSCVRSESFGLAVLSFFCSVSRLHASISTIHKTQHKSQR